MTDDRHSSQSIVPAQVPLMSSSVQFMSFYFQIAEFKSQWETLWRVQGQWHQNDLCKPIFYQGSLPNGPSEPHCMAVAIGWTTAYCISAGLVILYESGSCAFYTCEGNSRNIHWLKIWRIALLHKPQEDCTIRSLVNRTYRLHIFFAHHCSNDDCCWNAVHRWAQSLRYARYARRVINCCL